MLKDESAFQFLGEMIYPDAEKRVDEKEKDPAELKRKIEQKAQNQARKE